MTTTTHKVARRRNRRRAWRRAMDNVGRWVFRVCTQVLVLVLACAGMLAVLNHFGFAIGFLNISG